MTDGDTSVLLQRTSTARGPLAGQTPRGHTQKVVMVAGGFAQFRSVAWRYHESQSDAWLSASICLHIRLKAILRDLKNAQSRFEFPFKALLRDQDPSADDVLEQTIADGVTDGDGPCPPEDDPTKWFQSFLNGEDPFSIERRAGTRAWNDTILSTSAP